MRDITATWRDDTSRLTPQQVKFLERCDANPDHPNGPEGHRLGMLVIAEMLGGCGPGGLN
ncbi:hypothetical protein [Mycolicibacterium komossense]|uniref:Uncharacterized protein n=1 Tax=Mycolicibacterium komossense TaxID=1779 RepID=A0ABT3C8S7_9MYCO|nr:hypothetical protein [Mycolicibacterium komossense]MCV7225857.1 hypothetical protein [Mycolicibacterium komossense]